MSSNGSVCEMTNRERWARVLQCQTVDYIPDLEFGYWPETLDAWHAQGLPEYVTDNAKTNAYFGVSTWEYTPFKVGIEPDFQYQVIEEDERHKIVIDIDGVTKQVMKDGSSTLPKYIKFPIESRGDWDEFKKRLDPRSSGRVPSAEAWSGWLKDYHACEEPINLFVGSLFGWIRDWMGFENVSYAIMDSPDLIEEIMEHLTELTLSVLRRIPDDVRFEVAHMWEDMCFNAGPILPPRYFEQWMSPRLRRITDYLAERGCHSVWVDCDGKVDKLVLTCIIKR